MKQQHFCKYCGAKTSRLDMCSNCVKKKPLVKELLDRVKAKAEEIRPTKQGDGE